MANSVQAQPTNAAWALEPEEDRYRGVALPLAAALSALSVLAVVALTNAWSTSLGSGVSASILVILTAAGIYARWNAYCAMSRAHYVRVHGCSVEATITDVYPAAGNSSLAAVNYVYEQVHGIKRVPWAATRDLMAGSKIRVRYDKANVTSHIWLS